MEKVPKEKTTNDPFLRLQYIAYCRNYTTPGEDKELLDLVVLAKNYICMVKNLLYKDPIWNLYGDEDILVEYYSLRMHEEESYKTEVEGLIKGKGKTTEDLVDWADKRMAENKVKRDKKIQEGTFNFSPEKVKGSK